MTRRFDRSADLERARLNPAAVFATPEEILATPNLTRTEKIELLRRWAYDADELAVAEEEGMAGGEPTLQGQILAALDQLEAEAG